MKLKRLLSLVAMFFALGGGSLWAQTDVTSTYLTNADVTSADGWTNASINSGQQYSGAPDNTYLDACYWGSGTNTYDFYQTISLPQGVYKLTAATRANPNIGEGSCLYAKMGSTTYKSTTINHNNNTDGSLGAGWGWTSVVFEVPESNTEVQVGVVALAGWGVWFGADNFKLEKCDDDNTNWDITTVIANPSFEQGPFTAANNSIVEASGYKFSYTVDGWRDSYTVSGGSEGSHSYNFWCGTVSNLELSQSFSLPAGKYTLKADLFSDNVDAEHVVYAEMGGVKYKSESLSVANDFTTLSTSFSVTSANTTVKVGALATAWMKIDNFNLYYNGPVTMDYKELEGTVKKAAALNSVINDNSFASAIQTAQQMLTNTDAESQSEIDEQVASLNSLLSNYTTVSITNGGFDNSSSWATGNLAGSGSADSRNIDGWTAPAGGAWSASASMAYSSDNQLAGFNLPADMYGKTEGGVLAIALAWSGNITYTQTLSNLPAGVYALYCETYNVSTSSNAVSATNIGLGDKTYNKASTTSYTAGVWQANAQQIIVHETGNVTLNVGFSCGGSGSDNWAKMLVDNVTLYRIADNVTSSTVLSTDDVYFLKSSDSKYVSRGADSNTQTALDEFGVAVKVSNNDINETQFQCVDNNGYLFWNNEMVYTDGTKEGSGAKHSTYWKVESVDGGYTIYNTDYKKYLAAGNGVATLQNAAYTWTLQSASDHTTAMTEYQSNQASTAATAVGLDGIEDVSSLSTVDVSISALNPTTEFYSDNGNQGNAVGTRKNTVEIKKAGLYKFSIPAYTRAAGNNDAWTMYQAGTESLVAYAYFGTVKTQIRSIFSEEGKSSSTSGYAQPSGASQWFPNNTGAGDSEFSAGKYTNDVWVYIDATGTYEYGITNPSRALCSSWTYFGTPTLTLYTDKSTTTVDGVITYYGDWTEDGSVEVELTDDLLVLDVTNATGTFKVDASANSNALVYATTSKATVSGVTNNIVVDGTCANLVLTDGGTFKAHKNFEATSATYTMSSVATTSAGKTFGTLMVPFAVSGVPANNTAYALTEVAFGEEIHAGTVGTIAANTPVLVTKIGNYTASNVAVAATADTYTNGELTGTYKAMTALENTYVLQSHSGRVAFFMVGDTKPTVTPFRAYIKAQSAGARDFLNVVFDDETGITTLSDSPKGEGAIYDLSGRRVNNAVKGIYIINGKKVIK